MVPKVGKPHSFALTQKRYYPFTTSLLPKILHHRIPTSYDYTKKGEYGLFRPFQYGKWGKKQATLCEIQGAVKEQASPPRLALWTT